MSNYTPSDRLQPRHIERHANANSPSLLPIEEIPQSFGHQDSCVTYSIMRNPRTTLVLHADIQRDRKYLAGESLNPD